MLAMANTASATSVGCHISHWFLGLLPLYCTGQKTGGGVDDGGGGSHVLPIQPRKTSYLGEGYNLERNGGQVQRVHDEVHQVPPVMDVILETAVPHLFNLSPDES